MKVRAAFDQRSLHHNAADTFRRRLDVGKADERSGQCVGVLRAGHFVAVLRAGQFVWFWRGRANCSVSLYLGISGALARRHPSSARNFMSFTAPA